MKLPLFILWICALFLSHSLFGQPIPKSASPDTIIQNFHRVDNIQPTKNEALVRLKVMDFRKQPLADIQLWVHHKPSNQYWQGTSDERGEVIFLLPINLDYTTHVEQEVDYRKFSVPKEARHTQSVMVVYMSTRIKEVEKNDTIYQYLTQGQMPTASRVLVNIQMADLDDQPLPKEELYFVSENTNKVYLALTNSRGKTQLMLPKGDTYCVQTYAFQNITCKTYENSPHSRSSSFRLKTISTETFKQRERERASFLAMRDSMRHEQRLRDSARLAEMEGFNFYLQHCYAKREFDKITTNVEKVAVKDQEAIAKNPEYYAANKQEIKAMLYRNKDQWTAKRIIANIDCSMYQYLDELMVWNYSNEHERNNNTYWLFNGFQNNSKPSDLGNDRRGIFYVPNNDVEGFCKTVDKIVNFSCGGSRLENVVEALILGAKDKSPEEELLFIADNYSDVSDLDKLKELHVPVRVLLTASDYGVNEHYLEIAYRTGGSIHTLHEDIPSRNLQSLRDGEQLHVGKYVYQFFKGRFMKVG